MRRFFLKLLLFAAPFVGWQGLELLVLPIDYFAFRPWDALVVVNAQLATMGPFLPNQRLAKLEVGYSHYMGGYPDAPSKLTEWVTDRHGQRNRPRQPEPTRYEIVVQGDSNIAGSFLDQRDTLSETLERKCACPVYSAHGTRGFIWFDDDEVVRKPPRYWVHQIYPQPHDPASLLPWRFNMEGWSIRPARRWPQWVYVQEERFLKQPARQYLLARSGLAGMRSSLGKFPQAKSVDGVDPAAVEMRASADQRQDHMVRLASAVPGDKLADMGAAGKGASPAAASNYGSVLEELERRAVRMVERFRSRGTEVIYLFMPGPDYTTYAGLIRNLRDRGIGVVDFAPTSDLPRGYPDDYWQAADSHWTEEAVRDAADRILEEVKRKGGVERSAEYAAEEEIPGDGRNLIPNSEALAAIFFPAEVEFKSIGDPGRLREFRMTASGNAGQHYVISKPLQLGGASYTISFEVAPEDLSALRVQLQGANRSALIGDIDFKHMDVLTTPVGLARHNRGGTIQLDNGWYRVWMRAHVPWSQYTLILQLYGRNGALNFAPNRETVRIRALQVEKGNSASAYSPTSGPGSLGYQPGDGRNLLAPGAVDERVGENAIARLESLSPPDAEVREYSLTAVGSSSEHYLFIGGIAVEAQPHTLSLSVRAEGTKFLRLQLLDDAANGAFADFALNPPTESVISVGRGAKTDSSIQTIDRDWHRLTVTSTLLTGKASIIIQLRGSQGEYSFAPSGQAVRFREVQLERGQSASSYSKSRH